MSSSTNVSFASLSRLRRSVIFRQSLSTIVRRVMAIFIAQTIIILPVLAWGPSIFSWWTLRLVVCVLSLLASGYFVVALLGDVRRVRRFNWFADYIGRDEDGLRSDVLSIFQLSQSPTSPFSAGLTKALADSTWKSISNTQTKPLARSHRQTLRLVVGVMTAVISWLATSFVAGPKLRRSTLSLVRGDKQRSLPVANDPLIGNIALFIRYPDYMQRSAMSVRNSTGHVNAPSGSTVDVTAHPIRKLSKATLVFRSDRGTISHYAGEASHDESLHFKITIRDSGRYHFEANVSSSERMRDLLDRRIDIQKDRNPSVRIAIDGSDSGKLMQRTVGKPLRFTYRASDDFGLSRIELVHRIENEDEQRSVIWNRIESLPTRKRLIASHDFQLPLMQSRKSSELTFWIEALDNDRVSGPKRARSAQHRVTLITPLGNSTRLSNLWKKATTIALNLLSIRLLLDEAIRKGQKEAFDLHNKLRDKQTAAIRFFSRLKTQTDRDPLTPSIAKNLVSAISFHLRKSLPQRDFSTQRDKKRALKAFRSTKSRLRRSNTTTIGLLEQHILAIDALTNVIRHHKKTALAASLEREIERFQKLIEHREHRSEPQLETALKKQIDILKHYFELLSQLNTSANRRSAHSKFSATQTAALSDLERLEMLLQENDYQGAIAVLKRIQAAASMNYQLTRQHASRLEADQSLASVKALRHLSTELTTIEGKQRSLTKKTEKLALKQQRERHRVIRSSVKRALISTAADLSSSLSDLHQDLAAGTVSLSLKRAKQWAKWIESSLEQQDYVEARTLAKRTENQLVQLRDDRLAEASASSRASKSLRKSIQIAKQMHTQLHKLLETQRVGQEHSYKTRHITRLQKSISQSTSQLASRLEHDPQLQHLSPTFGSTIQQASRLMTQSQRHLKNGQFQRAASAQNAASTELSRLLQGLSNSRGTGRVSASISPEKIAIPAPEDFSPPDKLRQEVFRAMQQQRTDERSRSIKSYYRRLVQ